MATTRTLQPNYIVKFDLLPREITNPPISRTLSCPAEATFYQLHKALQIAFGWATTHCFEFEASRPRPRPPLPLHPRLQQQPSHPLPPPPAAEAEADLPPAPPLRVVDPDEEPLDFEPNMPGFPQPPNPTEKKANRFKLRQFFEDPAYAGYEMVYSYDFGDGWEHEMALLGTHVEDDGGGNNNASADANANANAVTTNHFVCVGGTGHPAAEDAGGSFGWEKLKEAYGAGRPDAEQRYLRRWFEKMCSNGSARGLAGARVDEWHREGVNQVLAGMKILKNFDRLRREQQQQQEEGEGEGEDEDEEGEVDVNYLV
ncbi:MM3350-like domain-containing protein [Daldinia caldariorum]|uniref:MM3350-like domain-containing protein n=1 Tax=Daldinia caldariorum TaxID=326644 RepID=UPI0020082E22|nr:MM3350-like domain-containing protein [Daldinia caldariorum]KAI1467507.1 MM3350-like domain-containing protein [Daldinia caldariorum]